MKGVFTRPLTSADMALLDEWRREYWKGDLEIPHGFQNPNVETVVATKDHKPIASLTGILSLVCDPFIHDPNASPTDLLFALVKLDTVLAYLGQKLGAVDVYIAVPNAEEKYIRLLQNYGWKPTVQNCVVMRRPLVPDTVPLIGPERDAAIQRVREEEAAREAAKTEEGEETLE